MDSLIFELQIVFYFQFFLSANVRHRIKTPKLLKLGKQLAIYEDSNGVRDYVITSRVK